MVRGWRKQALVREIQEHGTWLADCRESSRPRIFISEPITGNQHDMAKLKGSDGEEILQKTGGVFGDKGFIGDRLHHHPYPQARMP